LREIRHKEDRQLHLECNFLLAGPTGDAVGFVSISLRLGAWRLLWDSAGERSVDIRWANRCRERQYRPGWKM
jgi:hypothetical protein